MVGEREKRTTGAEFIDPKRALSSSQDQPPFPLPIHSSVREKREGEKRKEKKEYKKEIDKLMILIVLVLSCTIICTQINE